MGASILSFLVLLLTFLLVSNNVQCNPNYEEALAKSLLFFQGQRSGRLPSDQQLTWRSNSGLYDGRQANVCKLHFPCSLSFFVWSVWNSFWGVSVWSFKHCRMKEHHIFYVLLNVLLVKFQFRFTCRVSPCWLVILILLWLIVIFLSLRLAFDWHELIFHTAELNWHEFVQYF